MTNAAQANQPDNDTLDMHSPNLVDDNVQKIMALFPNCITESEDEHGKLKKVVDFDLLRQELSQSLVEGGQERYRLDWPGKRQAILEANSPIAKTLRPARDESVNFDTTENLFIEGDNLDALKLLQESYLGQVKMIYIDPPYNTGSDFIYKDNFTEDTQVFLERSEQIDEEGNRLVANTESNGRFHSDWLTMMYSRLKLAKNLLHDDGVIFISIDDNEVVNLRKICVEIFGEENQINPIVHNKQNAKNDTVNVQRNHEYLICFKKSTQFISSTKIKPSLIRKSITTREVFKDENSEKYYILKDPITTRGAGGVLNKRENLGYTVYYNELSGDFEALIDYDKDLAKTSNDEREVYLNNEEMIAKGYVPIRPPKVRGKLGAWTWDINKFNLDKDFLLIKKTKSGFNVIKREFVEGVSVYECNGKYLIDYISDENSRSIVDYSTNEGSTQLTEAIGKEGIFDNPKNINLLKYAISLVPFDDFLILDLFSGSGSTAHAVTQINSEDAGNRRFIMMQLPEGCNKKSEAYNAGYKTIAEISKDRIRRAGQKILEDNKDKEGIENLDIGFRVLKIDSTNMKDVYYTPDEYSQAELDNLESHIKEDRTGEDLLFQVMLDWGVPLSLPIEVKEIQGSSVYYVGIDSLVACFDTLTTDLIDEISKNKPLKFVSSELAIAHDQDKTNIKARFAQLSPDTQVKFI